MLYLSVAGITLVSLPRILWGFIDDEGYCLF